MVVRAMPVTLRKARTARAVRVVEEAALPDDVALGRQALLEQAHGGAARAGARAQRGDVHLHRRGHELRRGRRGQVRGAYLDGPGVEVLKATSAMPDLPVADIVRLTLTTRSLWPWR